jgi:hypothetical protein
MGEKLKRKGIYRIISSVIILVLITLIYFIFFFNNLRVEVFNKTSYDLDSLKIDNKFYHIKKGDALLVDNCKSISMQGGLPFGLPQANINGKIKDTFQILLCGTGVEEIKNGQYQFDIVLSEYNNLYRLYWEKHK